METEPTVTVRTYQRTRELIGRKEIQMNMPDKRTVDALLNRLAIKYDIDPRASTVLVNGRDIAHLDGMETCLGDGDLVTITVTPPAD